MEQTFYEKASQIWYSLSENSIEGVVDISLYKKLFNAFHIGSYYYYIFNVKKIGFEFVSPEISQVLGYDPKALDVAFLIDKIHPDDKPWFLNFEYKVNDFFKALNSDQIPNYKVSYDYRIRRNNGEYLRILQQVLTIDYDDRGAIVRTLGVHTDISHIKSPDSSALKPSLSFIGLNGEPSYHNINVKEVIRISKLQFTKRESEILLSLLNGRNSTETAKLLNISKLTVDTHRKNLLAKMQVGNTAELIAKSIKLGMI